MRAFQRGREQDLVRSYARITLCTGYARSSSVPRCRQHRHLIEAPMNRSCDQLKAKHVHVLNNVFHVMHAHWKTPALTAGGGAHKPAAAAAARRRVTGAGAALLRGALHRRQVVPGRRLRGQGLGPGHPGSVAVWPRREGSSYCSRRAPPDWQHPARPHGSADGAASRPPIGAEATRENGWARVPVRCVAMMG